MKMTMRMSLRLCRRFYSTHAARDQQLVGRRRFYKIVEIQPVESPWQSPHPLIPKRPGYNSYDDS